MKSTITADLAGVRVLVTRPKEQNANLIRLIESAGGQAIVFPALAIDASNNPEELASQIAKLDSSSLVIFISPNAVNYAVPAILQQRPKLLDTLELACIGRGSANALAAFGYHSQISPEDQSNSEALLELPQLKHVKARKVVIFRGNGGRDLLRQTLIDRGAKAIYVECYRRSKPAVDPAPLQQQLDAHGLDITTITSAEALRNLLDLLGETAGRQLLRLPMVVISPRIAQIAGELGLQSPARITANAGDDAIIEALKAWSRARHSGA